MSEEENIDDVVYVVLSCGNIERMKALGKVGNTLDDVLTMLLDYYEDLRRQEWINTKDNESQYNEELENERRSFTSLRNSSELL